MLLFLYFSQTKITILNITDTFNLEAQKHYITCAIISAELLCVGSLSPVRSPFFSERDNDTGRSVFNDMVSSNNLKQPSGWTSSEDEPDAMDEDTEGFSRYPLSHHVFNQLFLITLHP